MKKSHIRSLFISIFLCLFLTGCKEKKTEFFSEETELYQSDEMSAGHETALDVNQMMENTPRECINSQIYVDICGEICIPGVYEVPEGTRLYEVINLAGGLKEDACLEAINQAVLVTDGQKIYVPNKSEWNQNPSDNNFKDNSGISQSMDDGLININTASKEELCSLPGIGETRAQAIISYRNQNGEFKAKEEIQNVSGIKGGTYEKIRELIKVK